MMTILEALKIVGPFDIVQGDAMQRDNPHSTLRLNSNIAWVVGKGERSAHKQRTAIEVLNAAIKEDAKQDE